MHEAEGCENIKVFEESNDITKKLIDIIENLGVRLLEIEKNGKHC